MTVIDIPEKIIRASALKHPLAVTEGEPPLTDAFPKNPVPKRDIIGAKRKRKYLRHLRRALALRGNGEDDRADYELQKALDAVESLCVWYRSPFVLYPQNYVDRVNALFDRVEEEMGVVIGVRGRQGLPLCSYQNEIQDAKKVEQSAALSKSLLIDAHCSEEKALKWIDIPSNRRGDSRKRREKYDDIVGNNVFGYGDMIFLTKGRSRRCHIDLIAALNRSAKRSGTGDYFSANDDLTSALGFCRLPEDKAVADRLRVNLAHITYLSGLKSLSEDKAAAHRDFFNAFALLRTCSSGFRAEVNMCGAMEALLLRELGDSALRHGDTCGAYRCYTEALKIPAAGGITRSCVFSGLAALAMLSGETDEAERYLEQAQKACGDGGAEESQRKFRSAVVRYQQGQLHKDKAAMQETFEDFYALHRKDCTARVAAAFEELFGSKPAPIREPEPVPEPVPKPAPEPDVLQRFNMELERERLPEGGYLIDGNVIPEDGRGLYIDLRDFADGNPYIRYSGYALRERISQTKRRYEQLNIEYNAREDDDFFYNGDSRSANKYGDAVEDLVNGLVRSGDTQRAIEEARRLVNIREDAVDIQDGYGDWQARTRAICMLAWLTKSRKEYRRALALEWRSPGKKTAIFLMMKRCGLAEDKDKCRLLGHDWKDGACARCNLTLTDEYNSLKNLPRSLSEVEGWRFNGSYEHLTVCIEKALYEKKFTEKAGASAKGESAERLIFRLEHIDDEVPYKPEPYDPLWDEAGDYDPEEQFKKDMEAVKCAQWAHSEALCYFIGKRKREQGDAAEAAEYFKKAGAYLSAAAAFDRCGKPEEARQICLERMGCYFEGAAGNSSDCYRLALCCLLLGVVLRREEPLRTGIELLESIMIPQKNPQSSDFELHKVAVYFYGVFEKREDSDEN